LRADQSFRELTIVMNRFARRLRGGFPGVALTGLLLAAPSAFAQQAAEPTRVAVIDIDRIAQESARGQAMFTELQSLQEEILRGRQSREQEIRDLTNRAQSQLLSAEARADLTRDIERRNTDLQRWLEDQQRSFNESQTTGFTSLEAALGPVVEEVARERNIQLILRVTPGLTFIMDPALDISSEVITRFNALSAGGEEP
jgi:Skp family chaperone for outer membrane proteins